MATDTFMMITDIPGESVGTGHAGEIDVLSWNWGMTQTGTMHIATGGGAGKADAEDLTFVHYIDQASPLLMKACLSGLHIAEAKLTVRKAGGTAVEYLKITMKDLLVTGVQTGGASADERLTETVRLNFAVVNVEYASQAKDGTAGPTVATGPWNIAQGAEA